ncbi:MAG: hypothetical protein JO270_27360 [Acidobacteriaceae bacterium]|nr:hypothetical protein [Acidobacteriaceae bacterium]
MNSIPYNADFTYIDASSRHPLYRQHTDAVWFTEMQPANLTYLAFNHYPPAAELERVAADLFRSLDAHPGGALVITSVTMAAVTTSSLTGYCLKGWKGGGGYSSTVGCLHSLEERPFQLP